MSFGVLEALPKARRTVGDTVTSTGRRGTGGGPWGRPENEGGHALGHAAEHDRRETTMPISIS
jgi:hypothetical protein